MAVSVEIAGIFLVLTSGGFVSESVAVLRLESVAVLRLESVAGLELE